jgi:hypothetical protein
MIVGDNHFIGNRILKSAAILEAVPQLRTLASKISNLEAVCQTCSGTEEKRKELAETWNTVRQVILQLPEEQRKIIRDKASGGQPVRIAYKVGSGNDTRIDSGNL